MFRRFLTTDYTLQINGALRGGILYLNEEMSVYQNMTIGSWSERTYGSLDRIMELYDKLREMLDILNEETNGQFAKAISKRKRKDEWKRWWSILKRMVKEYIAIHCRDPKAETDKANK